VAGSIESAVWGGSLPPGGQGGTFAGLARASGISERDCELAAATGRLADIVGVAERRGRLSGAEARRRAIKRAAQGGDPRAALEYVEERERTRRANQHRLRMLRLLEHGP
jgi:hypothetical protein